MGQVKGNPIPTAEHAAFEAKYPNTGRANRDLGQIIAVVEETPIAIEEVAPIIEAPIIEEAPIVELAVIEEAPIIEEAPAVEETPAVIEEEPVV